jgi:hypothetical protein
LFQATNYGCIQGLVVRDSEPIFSPAPLVLVDLKLDVDEAARPELDFADFALPNEICRLMGHLDEIQNGTIQKIEVRAGVPRRLVFSPPVGKVLR